MNVLIGEILAVCLFAAICGFLMIGYPIAFSLAGLSLIFAVIGNLLGAFDFNFLLGLASRYFGVMNNEVLVSVPLFVFMGMILERSGIAESLLTTLGQLFGAIRGGLGYAVVMVGALLAASTGVVGATVITMGLISLPAMMRARYENRLTAGVICSSATLAQIIPPSTVLIFVADILQGVNQSAQLSLGNLQPDTVSVGDLFAGAMLPGLMLVGLYALWMFYKAQMQPETCPPLEMTAEERRGLVGRVLSALLAPLALIVAVLGSILMGIATPTESASIGALGAVALAAAKGKLRYALIRDAARQTAIASTMIFTILLGASMFSLVFRGLGGEHLVEEALKSMPGGVVGAMLVTMALMFLLGFFLDTFEIIFVVLPIFGPPLIVLGVDPIWLGVMIGMNLQTSFLTPPFGFTLFYLRGIAPPAMQTREIWSGAVPWIGLQILGLALVWFVADLATWLPNEIYRSEAASDAPSGPGSINFGTPPAEGGSGGYGSTY